MLKEGTTLYYAAEGQVVSGKAMDVTEGPLGMTFSIDSVGACEGPCVFSETVLGSTVFFSEREAREALERER